MAQHILVVDNDPLQCRTAELTIKKLFHCQVTTLTSGREAIEFLNSPKSKDVDAMLLDLVMPEVDGIEVLQKVKPVRPHLPIIIYSAHGEVDAAVRAMAEGAIDFVEKKDGEERLKVSLNNALRIQRLQGEVSRLQRTLSGKTSFSDIIGDSGAIRETIKLATQAAESNIPVLVKGESGVGKELFARAIHGAGPRSSKPFIPINCGAIPENLVESVLFGHEKGAFTGAIEKSIGKFREADGGTLFLDEIGELRQDLQVKLLRALQEGEVEPVGAGKPVRVDVRIISATNRSLKHDIEEGTFREDLYYRLNVFPITLPPLRERSHDIPKLLDHFVGLISHQEGKHIAGVTEDAKKLLASYAWPGNIRQLQNAVYRAVVLSSDEWLDVDDFSHIVEAVQSGAPMLLPRKKRPLADGHEAVNAAHSVPLLDDSGQCKTLADTEKEAISHALEFYNWRISEVARRLKIGRSTLYRKMTEYGIQEPGGSSSEDDEEIASRRA